MSVTFGATSLTYRVRVFVGASATLLTMAEIPARQAHVAR